MTPALGAEKILTEQGRLAFVVEALVRRAADHARLDQSEEQRLRDRVRQRVQELLDAWNTIANDFHQTGTQLQYQYEVGVAQRLLYEPLHKDLPGLPPRRRLFRANRSMRDVEASVNLWVKTLDGVEVEEEAQP